MAKKMIPKKPAEAADQDTVLVKLYLPRAVRNRLAAYASLEDINLNVAAARVLDANLPRYETGKGG